MRLRDITEARSVLPPVRPGCIRLYRGDSAKIETFDTGMTNLLSLFGHGIYLTDNKRVAGDYVSKGGNAETIFTLSHARTKQDVLDYWLRREAAKFDADGVDHSNEIAYWTHDVPFSNGHDWCLNTPATREEREKRYGYAREKWKRLSKDYEIRIKLDGTGVIQKKLPKSNGAIAVFDVPDAYVRDTLKADDECPEDVVDLLSHVLRKHGDEGTARDMRAFVRQQEWDGETVSFRQLYTSITADSPLTDREVQTEFREELQAMGYVGIEYVGGISMGGGYRHRAFVLWDDDKINSFRIT